MAEMTATAIAAAAERGAIALLPIGVIECHGPHLPVGTDAFIALELARLTRRYAAGMGREGIIAPPYYWGHQRHSRRLPRQFPHSPRDGGGIARDVIKSLNA